MRDVYLTKVIDAGLISVEEETLEVNSIPTFDSEDYDLFDKKEFKNYITAIEKMVRSSYEYRIFIRFLKENMDMNKCSFLENVSNENNSKIRIEIHHEPLTLFDIVLIVFNKRSSNQESLLVEDVSKEVAFLHYSLLVGLIPLSQTVHKLVHNNYLFIPLNTVMGNWQTFITAYQNYIMPEIQEKLDRVLEYTQNYIDGVIEENHILDKKYIYVDASAIYQAPNYNTILDNLNENIKQIEARNNVKYLTDNSRFDNNKPKLTPLLYKAS